MYHYEAESGKDRLLREIDLTRERIRSAENMLDHTSEPELAESAILEMEAARKKYNYLLKRIKQRCLPEEV